MKPVLALAVIDRRIAAAAIRSDGAIVRVVQALPHSNDDQRTVSIRALGALDSVRYAAGSPMAIGVTGDGAVSSDGECWTPTGIPQWQQFNLRSFFGDLFPVPIVLGDPEDARFAARLRWSDGVCETEETDLLRGAAALALTHLERSGRSDGR